MGKAMTITELLDLSTSSLEAITDAVLLPPMILASPAVLALVIGGLWSDLTGGRR